MLRDSVATESIYGFAPEQADAQPTEEPVFILTSNQLEDIVKQAVHNALESPKDLRQIVLDQARVIEALNAKLEAMEKDMDSLAENQLIQLRLINDLRHTPTEDSPLLDELYKEMKAIGRKQIDFATAARMVKRSKSRLIQLKAEIALDQRFILIPAESHSQKLLIRLREFYKTD